jgi:ribokinase
VQKENGLVDVIAIGAINWDINIWVEEFPVVGEEVPVNSVTRVPGGKAANVAVAAAKVSNRGTVALFGGLGDDEIGRMQLKVLADEGINISYIKSVQGFESGQAYITINKNGSNRIETLFGANHQFLPEDLLEPSRLLAVGECKVIAVSDPIISTAERIATLGHEHGATVLYDAGTKLQAGIKNLKNVLKYASILIMNSVEAKNLTGSANSSKARERLKQSGSDIGVIIKLGEKGCAYSSRNGEDFELPAIPLEKLGLKVVNTTGCGDAFLGVLAASLAQNFSEYESLERATVAGGLKATRPETRCGLDRQTLDRTLQSWRGIRKT